MLIALAVAARIAANPISNAFQKRLTAAPAHPVFIIAATHALLTAVVAPFAWHAGMTSLTRAFWLNMAVSASLAVVGNVLLVYALRAGDLSVLGSINAYKAVLSLVLGVFLSGEVPSATGAGGVLLILLGSAIVVERGEGHSRGTALVRFFREPGVQLRFAALACSATEAVFLKRAVLASAPVLVFYMWSVLGVVVAAVCGALVLNGQIGSEMRTFRRRWRMYVCLAAATGVMQLTTLLTFGALQVGYSLALFQLSTLISVFLGYRYFQERSIARRLAGAVVMIVGALMIVMGGRR